MAAGRHLGMMALSRVTLASAGLFFVKNAQQAVWWPRVLPVRIRCRSLQPSTYPLGKEREGRTGLRDEWEARVVEGEKWGEKGWRRIRCIKEKVDRGRWGGILQF